MSRYIDIHTHHPTLSHIEPQGVGVHPWDAELAGEADIEKYASATLIGEIGLDFACDIDRTKQEAIFRRELELAQHLKKPVVLHCVRAFEPTMNILKEYDLKAVIFHGFIGSKQQATAAINRGYYLSFGASSFKSPKTIEALKNTPLDRVFIESDDSQQKIEDIYAKIAQLRGVEIESLQQAILENYDKIFDTQLCKKNG
ncbi:MAG: TatD family hydrolase [Alistipes sp.]|nr:TatD family hydrolase [Alistipes sp.]